MVLDRFTFNEFQLPQILPGIMKCMRTKLLMFESKLFKGSLEFFVEVDLVSVTSQQPSSKFLLIYNYKEVFNLGEVGAKPCPKYWSLNVLGVILSWQIN